LPQALSLARTLHEPPAPTADIAVLPGVLGSPFDRLRTSGPRDVMPSAPQVQSRGVPGWFPGGTAIATIPLRRPVRNAG